MEKNSRILGGLFGVACGDALGGTLEFLTQTEGQKKYGYLKDIKRSIDVSEVSFEYVGFLTAE